MDVDHPPRIIVVTSPKQSDGKSTIAANLAAAIAIGGQPVTLIDGDLRRPDGGRLARPGRRRGPHRRAGRPGQRPSRSCRTTPTCPGLRVLASGAIPPNPSELLGSQAMRTLISDLAKDAMVIIDAPPLLPVTDAAVLTRSADGAIIVITHGGTLDSELQASLNHISTVHGRTLGIVFNRMRRSASGGYYGGDYYRVRVRGRGRGSPSGDQARPGGRRASTVHAARAAEPGRARRADAELELSCQTEQLPRLRRRHRGALGQGADRDRPLDELGVGLDRHAPADREHVLHADPQVAALGEAGQHHG